MAWRRPSTNASGDTEIRSARHSDRRRAWGPTTIARGDLAAAVARLKQERPDGYLLAQGGVRFARSLVQSGLIDEYRLVIHRVVAPFACGVQLIVTGPVSAVSVSPTVALTVEPVSTGDRAGPRRRPGAGPYRRRQQDGARADSRTAGLRRPGSDQTAASSPARSGHICGRARRYRAQPLRTAHKSGDRLPSPGSWSDQSGR